MIPKFVSLQSLHEECRDLWFNAAVATSAFIGASAIFAVFGYWKICAMCAVAAGIAAGIAVGAQRIEERF